MFVFVFVFFFLWRKKEVRFKVCFKIGRWRIPLAWEVNFFQALEAVW